MKKILFIGFLFLLIQSVSAGDIQITCEPGFSVYVDGNNKGITNDFLNGITISNIPEGTHQVVLKKEGFADLIYNVVIEKNKTFELVVKKQGDEKISSLTSTDSARIKKLTGTLILKSLPLYSDVQLNGKLIGKSDLKIDNLEAGPFSVVFSYKGKTMTYKGILTSDDELTIKADYSTGSVQAKSLMDEYKDKAQIVISLKADWSSCREGGPAIVRKWSGKSYWDNIDKQSPGTFMVTVESKDTGMKKWYELRRYENQKIQLEKFFLEKTSSILISYHCYAFKVSASDSPNTPIYDKADYKGKIFAIEKGKKNLFEISMQREDITINNTIGKIESE